MAGGIVEVQQQVLEILDRLTPDECIHHRPDHERDQDAGCATLEKFARTIVERELKIAGGYHEQGYAGARQDVKGRDPECVRLSQDQRAFAPEVEGLTTVGQHHPEAGEDSKPVYPNFSLFVHIVLL